MAEEIFFENAKVKITSARAIFENQTHALAGITSVSGVKVRTPGAKVVYIISLALIFQMFSEGGMAYLYMPVIIFILGWIAENFLSKYVIVFSSASGKSNAFHSRDKQLINDIVKAINDAIVHRG